MPTSDLYNVIPIMTVIQNLQPRSILDVGCGFGKYGVLMREYLDIWHQRLESSSWQVRLEAIDAFPAYRSPIWDYVYQRVHIGEAQQIIPTLGRFDAILIADVIEHFDKEVAIQVVEKCLEQTPVLIVSTPKEFYPQPDVNSNLYEIHKCLWTAQDFPAKYHVHTISALSCNIFIASRSPLSWQQLYPGDITDLLYLRSRHKLRGLKMIGWPLSAGLRMLNRILA